MQVQSTNVAAPKMAAPSKRAFTKSAPADSCPASEAEAKLSCQNTRSVRNAFSQAEDIAVASWLLLNPRQMFHHAATIAPRAFDSSLAVHAEQRLKDMSSPWGEEGMMMPLEASADGAEPGKDLLLVPVRLFGTKLVGYSFGGSSEVRRQDFCPYGAPTNAFLPHYVGRFSFDVAKNDLLIIAHYAKHGATGIISVRGGARRERSLYVVPPGAYDQKNLPSKVFSMTFGVETREDWAPKYQFAVGADGEGEWKWIIEALARLERMLKGRFVCASMRRDDMDCGSGEVLNRRTAGTESVFDVKDAVSMRVFRDTAARCYYSYMSGVSRAAAASNAGGSGSGGGDGGDGGDGDREMQPAPHEPPQQC